jgi:hypothetical protein
MVVPGRERASSSPVFDWDTILRIDVTQLDSSEKVLMVYSLAQYLGLTLLTLLTGLFESEAKPLWEDVKRFYSCRMNNGLVQEFGPLRIWNIWVQYSNTLEQHLMDHVVKPTALHMGRREMYSAVRDPLLKVNLSKITLKEVCETLDPRLLQQKYERSTPFIFEFLIHLIETPNQYRLRYKKSPESHEGTGDTSSDDSDDDILSTKLLNRRKDRVGD